MKQFNLESGSTMNKQILYACLTAFGMLCVFSLLIFLKNEMIGSEKSEKLAIESAQSYVDSSYPHLEMEFKEANYQFPNGTFYYVSFVSPTNKETTVGVSVSRKGEILSEDYVDDPDGHNTYKQLHKSYETLVTRVFKPQKISPHIELKSSVLYPYEVISREVDGVPLYKLNALNESDVRLMGKENGLLSLNIKTEKFSYSGASKLLKEIKQQCDEENVPFHAINLAINAEDKNLRFEKVRYDEIDESDLVDTLKRRENSL